MESNSVTNYSTEDIQSAVSVTPLWDETSYDGTLLSTPDCVPIPGQKSFEGRLSDRWSTPEWSYRTMVAITVSCPHRLIIDPDLSGKTTAGENPLHLTSLFIRQGAG